MAKEIASFKEYTHVPVAQIQNLLKTDLQVGLRSQEAAKRLRNYGPNKIAHHRKTWVSILISQIKSPFIYILIGVALISLLMGNQQEAMVVNFIIALNILFGFYQEFKAEKTAYTLEQYLTSTITVVRDGAQQDIATQLLVPGDIIVLYPGDVIPADIRFIEAQSATVDESMLTGESEPIVKTAQPLEKETTVIYEATNIGFAGTTLLSGKATGVVFATGITSSLGTLARTASSINGSRINKTVAQFSTIILYIAFFSLAIIILLHLLIKGTSDYLMLILFASTLAISIVPEALPLVMTFALSQGALRLARKKTIVKRLSAIEDLGNIEILCTDKTGTLTENVLAVAQVYGDKNTVLPYGAIASTYVKGHAAGKGFDHALYQALTDAQKEYVQKVKRHDEIPFDPTRVSNVVLASIADEPTVIVRGAAEVIFTMCASVSEPTRSQCNTWIHEQSAQGNRVIGIAAKKVDKAHPGKLQKQDEEQLDFIGLISFVDPLKKSAVAALAKARDLNITIKLISGDSASVCTAIAKQLHLIEDEQMVMTGKEFAQKTEEEKINIVHNYSVFARMLPEHKYEVISLLQKTNTVGYLGDGINDVLALKKADVGIAGHDAVAVAREASDIIILKKSLMIVIDGIQEGRIVFTNTLKYLRTTLAGNFGNFYSLGIAALWLPFLPMLPLQILLLNFLSDLPMVAIATDTVGLDALRRPERHDIRGTLLFAIILGLVSTLFDFIFLGSFLRYGAPIVQTGWFAMSLLSELVLIFSVRSTHLIFFGSVPSIPLLLSACVVAILTIIMPYTQFGQHYFSFVPLNAMHYVWIAGLLVAYLCVTELFKKLYYRLYVK